MTAAPDPHLEPDHRPEWVGGIVTLPSSITEGDKTYRMARTMLPDSSCQTELAPHSLRALCPLAIYEI